MRTPRRTLNSVVLVCATSIMVLSVAAPKSAMAATAGLDCKPSNLWFKQVTVGTEKNFNASVTNIGSSNITVSHVSVQGAGFRVGAANLPWTLAPGQKVWFQVSFAPQTAGHVDGTVGFTSSASTSEQYLLNVHGTAVAGNVLNPYPVSISFGNVSVGTTSQRTEVLTNSGTSNINISQTNVAGSGFRVSGLSTPLTLAAGQKVSFIVSFIPQLTGITSGALSVISDAADSTLTVALSATGVSAGALTPAAASISYGSVQVGNSIARPATLTNTGTADVTISQASVSGAGFSISGLVPPVTLTPGQSYTFQTAFAPNAAGSVNGAITVASNASNTTVDISLSGTATASGLLTLSPASLNFGSVVVGQNKSMSATLGASGSSVTLSSATASSPEFTMGGLSFPYTIAAGQSAQVNITFKPQSSGSASGSISFNSNASTTPMTETLLGTGTAAVQHRVDLSWNGSTSTVTGYNVYRGSQAGGPYSKINSLPNAGTNYSDSSVQAGQVYFYVTTAVDSTGSESLHSNEVSASVPSP